MAEGVHRGGVQQRDGAALGEVDVQNGEGGSSSLAMRRASPASAAPTEKYCACSRRP
jgi:hypothetical protein